MSIFARPHYTSEVTNFINQMKKDKPQLEAQQLAGRALLQDPEWARKVKEGRTEELAPFERSAMAKLY